MSEFIKITEDNIEKEHLCCIIAKKSRIPAWKRNGHVFLKLNEKATVFIEYEPIETA